MCSREGLLNLENEKYVVSLSLIWAELSFSSLLLFWSIRPQGMNSSRLSLGPIYLLPHTQRQICIKVQQPSWTSPFTLY